MYALCPMNVQIPPHPGSGTHLSISPGHTVPGVWKEMQGRAAQQRTLPSETVADTIDDVMVIVGILMSRREVAGILPLWSSS